MTTPKNTAKTNKEIAVERELKALSAIAANGWLITRHVGLWAYCDAKNEHVKTSKAQQVLKRLEAKGLVFNRKQDDDNAQKMSAWVLTKNGADYTNAYFDSVGIAEYAHHGHDLGLIDWLANTRIAEYLGQRLSEKGVIGAAGPAALRAGIGGANFKGCDGLYWTEDRFNFDSYKVVGVLNVRSAREGAQRVLKQLLKQNISPDLIGDPLVVSALRKRVTSVD